MMLSYWEHDWEGFCVVNRSFSNPFNFWFWEKTAGVSLHSCGGRSIDLAVGAASGKRLITTRISDKVAYAWSWWAYAAQPSRATVAALDGPLGSFVLLSEEAHVVSPSVRKASRARRSRQRALPMRAGRGQSCFRLECQSKNSNRIWLLVPTLERSRLR